jgi:hypothetical protein
MRQEVPETVRNKLKEYRDELDELRVFVRAPHVRCALPSTARGGLTVQPTLAAGLRGRRATTGRRWIRAVSSARVVPRLLLTGLAHGAGRSCRWTAGCSRCTAARSVRDARWSSSKRRRPRTNVSARCSASPCRWDPGCQGLESPLLHQQRCAGRAREVGGRGIERTRASERASARLFATGWRRDRPSLSEKVGCTLGSATLSQRGGRKEKREGHSSRRRAAPLALRGTAAIHGETLRERVGGGQAVRWRAPQRGGGVRHAGSAEDRSLHRAHGR